MTVYGVTSEGFRRKTETEIVADMEADELGDIADNLDVSADSIVGQLNGVFGRQLGIVWEQLEIIYGTFDPDAAEGRALENVAKISGTVREGSTKSEVILTCNLDDGTTLLAGVHFAAIENHPETRWTPVADYPAVGSGNKTITFQCELTGPVPGYGGTINTINTPIVGWNSVLNADDAELGLDIDLDAQLRLRREQELAAMGSATVRAVYAAVEAAFPDQITTLNVAENDTDVVSDGMPPHSIEVLIFDGEVPTVNANAIAQVILDAKAGGIQAYGTSSGTATATLNGVTQNVAVGFTRAAQVPVYLTIDITKKSGYTSDALVAQYVAKAANAYFQPGDDIIRSVIESMPFAVGGVKDVTRVRLGLSASPSGTANLSMTSRQIGRFSTSRIVINAT